jgi:prefoldin subunit 5
MADGINGKRDAAVSALRELVAALEAEEARLTAELAKVSAERKDAAKTLATLDPDAAPRRRGRPRSKPAPVPVAA